MSNANRMTLATAVATLLTAGCLLPLTEDRDYLLLTALLIGGSAVIGIVARRLRLAEGAIRLLLVLPGVLLLFWIGWDNLADLMAGTGEFVRISVAPMAAHEGFSLISSFVLWLLFLVAESITVGLERPGWVFPVLVIPYLVPAMVLPEEASPLLFVLVAAGYLLVLATSTFGAHLERAEKPAPSTGLRRGVFLTATVAALIAGLGTGLISTTIPERGTAWIGSGVGPGTIQLGDPSQDLVRNIRANSNKVVIRYSAADGHGRYLRLTALSAFDSTGFHLVATDLMPGTPPPDPRLRAVQPVSIRVQVDDFGSEYLPLPWVPGSWEADGDWRYDPRTLSVVSVDADRKRATRNLAYSATVLDFQPGQQEIAAAGAGDPGDNGLTLDLPAELDPQVRELATTITQDATTDGERVLALLTWLRSDAFSYTTTAVSGSTLDTVSDFLLNSRSGYCEQFSGSMAILARVLGIPSRMVIGFLPGESTGNNSFEVSVRQMHAWTEVYLDGLGWVAFDPTPTGAANASPPPTPDASTTGPEPSVPTSTRAPNQPTSDPAPENTASGSRWTASLGWVAGGIGLAAVVALCPLALRSWRRWRRLRPDRNPATMAEDAWDELRDTVLDSGLVWPAGTPRQTAAELSGVLGAQARESAQA
ncbi:MAG: DUF3488 and transglutaminase-like domain-containing protein, partial [Propionicimonas sp.]|nr:DUF3488 and transglutaminase-like domain-containing protein [Propionicimonas sp.]